MGYVKEPDGVDFLIQSPPLTKEQKEALSAFISADKEKNRLCKLQRETIVKRKTKQFA